VVVEKDKDRFLKGREGDHLVTTFQCDLCHFRNVVGWSLQATFGSDDLLLKFIRHANLDALWSREPGTVKNMAHKVWYLQDKVRHLSLDVKRMLPKMGHFLVRDVHGMGIAVCILLR
jgi:hypothetical protein